MKKIASFTIDHNKLLRGIYKSRIDSVGSESVTTFDIRMKEPNREPVIDIPALHAMEHIGATFLRNHPVWADKTIYFGPMGCRTGNYVIFKGDLEPADVLDIVKELFQFVADFTEAVPGASPKDCGNHLSMDLPMAVWESQKFLNEVLIPIKDENMIYP